MIIRKLEEVRKTGVEMEGVQGIAKQLVIGSGYGVPNCSFRVFTVETGGHTPHHSQDVHQFRNLGDEPFVFICAVPKQPE